MSELRRNAIKAVSPQNDNVLFAQSRNVLLTPPGWGGARRTATDDASRTGPPGGPEEGEEEADHAEGGSRRTGDHGKAREAPAATCKRRGDKVVAHALRGLPSNRKISAETEQEAISILMQPVYRGFGPTLAVEYLAKKHDIEVSRETVRRWMIGARLWRAHKQRVEKIHEWRPRRSRLGELVQWDTSPHGWLEGRGDEMLLINMIDDATSQWFARFVPSDSTVENMNVLERYMKKHRAAVGLLHRQSGDLSRPRRRLKRDGGSRLGKKPGGVATDADRTRSPRAGNPVDCTAHSPQAKGRVERGFLTAQDRLVKGLRVAGVTTP